MVLVGVAGISLTAYYYHWIPLVAISAAKSIKSGFSAGVLSSIASGTKRSRIGKSVAVAAGGGAIAGAFGSAALATSAGAGTETFIAAFVGALAAVISATSYSSVVNGVIHNRYGWCLLGSNKQWDCWKKIIKDSSNDSRGKLVRDIILDPRVKNVTIHDKKKNLLIITNIWGEKFEVKFSKLPIGPMVAHASMVLNDPCD